MAETRTAVVPPSGGEREREREREREKKRERERERERPTTACFIASLGPTDTLPLLSEYCNLIFSAARESRTRIPASFRGYEPGYQQKL